MKSVNSFPKLIVDFIKQESKYIADTFVENDSYEYSLNDKIHDDLKPHIKSKLKDCIDDYSRFIKIIHCNPVDIPSSIYVYYIENLQITIDDSLRKVTIQRLTFHGLYGCIWKYLINDRSTINDVEEVLEIMGETLQENNNLKVGIFKSLIESQNLDFNQSLKSVIIDVACHTFSLSKSEIIKVLDNLDTSFNIDTFMPTNDWEWLLFNRQLLKNKRPLVNIRPVEQLHHKLPGWFSFITDGSKIDSKLHLLSILTSGKGLMINDYDFSKILDLNYLSLEELYQVLINEYLESSNFSSALTSIAEIAMEKNNDDIVFDIMKKNHQIMRLSTLSEILTYFYKKGSPKLNNLLEMLLDENRDPNEVVFGNFLRSCVPISDCSPLIHKTILSLHRSEDFHIFLRNHFSINFKDRQEILDLYKNFVKSDIISTKILLEILRNIMLRNRIFDHDIINVLFGRSIEKLRVHDDIFPDVKTKRKFQKTIRAIAQSISDLELKQVQIVLQNIYLYVNGHDFMKHTSKTFKSFVFEKLLEQTIRFLNRKHTHPEVVDLISGLSIDNQIKLPVVYMLQVKANPSYSLTILDDFNDKKVQLTSNMVKYIEKGILENGIENGYQKIKRFNEFRTRMLQHDHNIEFNRNNVVLLIKMIIESSKDVENQRLLKVIKSFGKQQRLPSYVINKWIERAKNV